jgi:agmatine/peptidylarginine deiminase
MQQEHTKTRFPAEWEPQSAVMLTWPHQATDWAAILPQVEPVFVRIAQEVAKRQRLIISCHCSNDLEHLSQLLTSKGLDMGQVSLFVQPSNDSWVRDHGPVSCYRNGHLELLDFGFDGWGGKYAAELDNALSAGLKAQGAFGDTPLKTIDLVIEGGALETDGQGTLLGVARCLLDERRNPGMTQARMEALLSEHLGISHFLWLWQGGLDGDDTDGHIDTLARFSESSAILYQASFGPHDPNHQALSAMAVELAALRDARGQPYSCLPLPSPQPIRNAEGALLPASYANFLIINGALLAPVYGDPADEQALEVLAQGFPGRDIIPIDCRSLIQQFGSLHCVTMQLAM